MIIFLIFINSLLFSQNYEANFNKANKLFQSNEFQKAITEYENLSQENLKSAELFYNLGNAYYRNEQIGLAILNYNKALKLDDGFEDARFNLAIAKLKTIDKFEEVPKFFLDDINDSIARTFNEKQWTIINISFSFVLLGLFIFFRTRKSSNSKKQALILIFITIFFFAFTSFYGYKQLKYESSYTNGVITATSTYIKSSPDENSKDLIILHEGTSFELLDKVGDWVELKLSDGNKGWASIHDIQRF
jgi:tetratricopeptide (TPR) repeat protein